MWLCKGLWDKLRGTVSGYAITQLSQIADYEGGCCMLQQPISIDFILCTAIFHDT